MANPLTKADKISTAAAATVHELNDELTIVLSVLSDATRKSGADPQLVEARNAAQRAAWRCAGLLSYSMRNGAQRTPAAPEVLMTSTCAVA